MSAPTPRLPQAIADSATLIRLTKIPVPHENRSYFYFSSFHVVQ